MLPKVLDLAARRHLLRDGVYGIPLAFSALLLDPHQGRNLIGAMEAYERAERHLKEQLAEDTDDDPSALTEAYMAESAEHLYALCKAVVPRLLQKLRSGAWKAAGMARHAGNEWRDIQTGVWDYIGSTTAYEVLRGCVTLAGLEYRGIRIRPASSVPFEMAALAFHEPGFLMRFFRAERNDDSAAVNKHLRSINRSLVFLINQRAFLASYDKPEGGQSLIDSTIMVPDRVSFSKSDLTLSNGTTLRNVRVWFPDPFVEVTPMPVAVTNWPQKSPQQPAPGSGRQGDARRNANRKTSQRAKGHRPQEFDRAAFDQEYWMIQSQPDKLGTMTLRQYMIKWSGKLKSRHDGKKTPSNQWVDTQIRRLKAQKHTK